MNKKTIRDLSVAGRRALVRVDFNVPVKDGVVSDDTRIRAALPTITYLLENGAAVVLMSHLGRPKGGQVEAEFSLKPVSYRLKELLGRAVHFASDCIGAEAQNAAKQLEAGEVLLLENVRFHKEEEGKVKLGESASADQVKAAKAEMKRKQEAFAKELSLLGDFYVNDAFGTAHRAHASTAVITKFFKENVAGFLMEKEIDYLGRALKDAKHPFIAVLGGAKVSDKVGVIENLLGKVDVLIIGGAMAYTFYRAKGIPTGSSLVEEDKVALAGDILRRADERKVKLLLPVDNIVADSFSESAQSKVALEKDIPPGWMALDIGPHSAELFGAEISKAKTIVWNGPMGCFEMAPFASGTLAVAKAVAEATSSPSGAVSIVGGGDSVSAVNKSGFAARITHLSTGGGASLEFLEGKALPGVEALSDC